MKITELLRTEALERVPAESAGPGDIIAIAGIPDIMIGETLADPNDPHPLPLITVDEPAISMTIGTNTSPLAGREKGTKVTARLVKDRLASSSATCRCRSSRPSARTPGSPRPRRARARDPGRDHAPRGLRADRGPLLAVTKEINGKVHEPVERLLVDVPEEYLGAVTQLVSVRRGRMETMTNHGTGWVRLAFVIPSRA